MPSPDMISHVMFYTSHTRQERSNVKWKVCKLVAMARATQQMRNCESVAKSQSPGPTTFSMPCTGTCVSHVSFRSKCYAAVKQERPVNTRAPRVFCV